MGRYDIAKGEKKDFKKSLKYPIDPLLKELHEAQKEIEDTDIQAAQTSIRGGNLLLRGPNGFQVSIPVRYVSVHHAENNYGSELRLKIPPSVAQSLSADITKNNPNELFRLSGLKTYDLQRVSFE